MKLVFFAPRFHTNQVEIINILISYGYEVRFYSSNSSIIENYDKIKPTLIPKSILNIFSKYFKFINSNYELISVVNFFKILKFENPKFIIIRDPVSLSPLIAAFLAKILKIKVIFYTQVNISSPKNIFQYLYYNSLIYFFGARWYSPIHGSEQPILKYNIPKLYHLPFPTSILRRSDLNVIDKITNLLTIGKFQKRKNHILLLKAVNILKEQFTIHLTIIGECTTKEHFSLLEELNSYIKLNNLQKIITIACNVRPQEINKFYLKSNLFILPSYNEPASISILEAMSFSMPVIVSDDCGNKDFVINGLTGFHFKKNSLSDLSLKIFKILNNRSTFNDMSRETEFHTKNNFSKDHFINNFKNILKSFE